MEPIIWIIGYLLIINLVAFITMWSDKQKAKKKAWRIPEATLFMLAIIGGSIGSIAGMYTFRHKTKHMKFVVFMPVILAVQVLLILAVLLSPLININIL